MIDVKLNARLGDMPKQRVPNSEKDEYWAGRTIDYCIAAGLACNDRTKTEQLLEILHGEMPDEFYRKTLNPYNATKENFKRFPATLRNLDIINDVVRRYLSEYVKSQHEFIVGANNPEIIMARDAAIREDIVKRAMLAFQQELQRRIQQQQAENAQLEAQGQPTQEVDPEQLAGDAEEFEKNFIDNYIDEISAQAQQLLEVIDDVLNNETIIPVEYFNYIVTGEVYSFHTVRGKKLVKEWVPTTDMFPVPNGEQMVSKYDIVARRMLMSYNQVIDQFSDELSDEELEFITKYYNPSTVGATRTLSLNAYTYYFPEKCKNYENDNREIFPSDGYDLRLKNGELLEVWHVNWRGYTQVKILKYVNEVGLVDEIIVSDDFEFNPELGHIEITSVYKPQVYEGYRIGGQRFGIYPGGAKPIPFQLDDDIRLQYCGLQEVLPQMGRFSIVGILTPFQILINIFSYHREMMIAKNKMFILVAAKSLFGEDAEEAIYNIAAEGIFPYDDAEDINSSKAQSIKMLDANISGYITEISNLIESIKASAREMVDMTPQRYGQIATSAGKGTTEEAIIRGSMGTVIINYMFDKFREDEYLIDLNNSKLAWIDGLDTSYYDKSDRKQYLSLNVNNHTLGQYVIKAKNSDRETEKFEQLKEWAFNASQNGDLMSAVAAITSGNISSLKLAINRYQEIRQKNEESLRQLDQQLEETKNKAVLEQIAAKGEQDARLAEIKGYYDLLAKGMDTEAAMAALANQPAQAAPQDNSAELSLKQAELNEKKRAKDLDMINSALDRDNELKIAKENKNRYDSSKSKSSSTKK